METSSSTSEIGRTPGGRKLIAVVYADMVGYSRLIGLDDIGTLDRLRTLRRTVLDPAINEHGGRIVNTGGDSLLIVFDSIDGAVRCAIKVQQQVPAYVGDQLPDWTICFRVGINAGDVIPVASSRDFEAALETQSALVGEWLEDCADALTNPLLSIAVLLDLRAIVIDGNLARPLIERLVAPLRALLITHVPEAREPTELKVGTIGRNAAAIGAATLPLYCSYGPDQDALFGS